MPHRDADGTEKHETMNLESPVSVDVDYRLLFDSIDQGFCVIEVIFDDAGRPVDYRFVEANAAFEQQTGLRKAVGRTVKELVPDHEEHWFEIYGRVATTGRSERFTNEATQLKDGRWFDVYAFRVGRASTRRVAVLFQDITERRRAEEGLRRAELAERSARRQAELLAAVMTELEKVDGVSGRASRLAELLVPQFAVFCSVHLPGRSKPVAVVGSGEADIELPMPMGANLAGKLGLAFDGASARVDVDLSFARDIAQRAGLLLGNSRLQEEEHAVIQRLQAALLPGEMLDHPRVGIAARYHAGSSGLEVGGDWYDSFLLTDGKIGLVVGDVVGHGLDAAAAMGRVRNALIALAARADGPGGLLTALDQFVSGPNGTEYATACYAILDPASGELRYASAGHPPMLLRSASGEILWLDGGRSPPLGGAGRDDRPHAEVTLSPGALLVLYSDGLIERRGEPLSVGLSRLAATVQTSADGSLGDLSDRLVTDLGAGWEREDDTVVMCVRLNPVSSECFRRVFPARPEELSRLRRAVTEWVSQQGIGEKEHIDLLLALGEASSNAVEHAYNPDRGDPCRDTTRGQSSGGFGHRLRTMEGSGRRRQP